MYVNNNPINFIDPTGLYLSPWHGLLTYVSMRVTGHDPVTSGIAATGSVVADYRPGSQNPENAFWHGMSQEGQSILEAQTKADQFIKDQIAKGNPWDLGYGTHTGEDIFAQGHQYQVWDGQINLFDPAFLNHLWSDAFPSISNLWNSFLKDLAIIEEYDKQSGKRDPPCN